MYGNNIEYEFTHRVTSVTVTIDASGMTMTNLKEIYFHSLSDTTFYNIQPETTFVVADNYDDTVFEINKAGVFNRKLKIHIANNKDVGYDIITYTEDPEVESGHVNINITINPKKIYKSESLIQHDMIQLFYKKLLPFYKLEAFAIQSNEIHRMGNIKRVSFDVPAQKYKVIFENGLNILYDGMPFDNDGQVDIVGTQQMTPPEALWLIDESFTDLKFINKARIMSTEVENLSPETIGDNWTTLIQQLDSGDVYIDEILAEFPTINQILRHNYTLTMNNDNRLIKHITESIVEFTWLPTREIYMSNENYLYIDIKLTILNSDDPTIIRNVNLHCKVLNNYGEVIEGVTT